ncbi:MAG: FKBP-type peptidyl-prolyl cis-trans isomerase [Planctomycetota bacterium]|nr:FKBP-type peptidyl-prolyl cis-trans isomerase [Planctomycetota bacterium]
MDLHDLSNLARRGLLAAAILAATPPIGLAQETTDTTNAPQDEAEVIRREVLESGLVIETLEEGQGDACSIDSIVEVHCRGILESGEKFFDTRDRGAALEYPVRGFIKGWQQGVPGMKPGEKRRLTVPADLAYGKEGRPGDPGIPPNATLTFVIELIDFTDVEVETLEEGEGSTCPQGTVVTVRYKGMLEDGSVFDETKEGDEPVTLPLDQMIPGWQVGVPGMKRGEVRKLVVPPQFAFGDQGVPGPEGEPAVIPPSETLTFEIEMVDFYTVEIEEIEEGAGEPAPQGATVTIYYTGMLEDGTVFDSTEGKGAYTSPLGNLIKGWQMGIPGMKPGGKRRLTIPYQLAYGEQGSPPTIPPKATLIFEVELVSFK